MFLQLYLGKYIGNILFSKSFDSQGTKDVGPMELNIHFDLRVLNVEFLGGD